MSYKRDGYIFRSEDRDPSSNTELRKLILLQHYVFPFGNTIKINWHTSISIEWFRTKFKKSVEIEISLNTKNSSALRVPKFLLIQVLPNLKGSVKLLKLKMIFKK